MEQEQNSKDIDEAAEKYADEKRSKISDDEVMKYIFKDVIQSNAAKQFISEQKPLDDKNSVHWTHLFLPVLLNYKNGLVNENGIMSWLETQVFKPLADCIPDEEQKPAGVWVDWQTHPKQYGEYFITICNGYKTVLIYDDIDRQWREQYKSTPYHGINFKWWDESQTQKSLNNNK